MACVDILMRHFDHAGGGRYMIWLVSPVAREAKMGPHNRNNEGWYGIQKMRDTRYWGRGGEDEE